MSTDITSDLHYYAVQDCAFLLTDSQCSKPLQDFGYAGYTMTHADVMKISDTRITRHGKNSYEMMHLAEGYVKKFGVVRKDVVRIAETYWDNIFFIIHIVENIGINECRSHDLKHFLKDGITVSDAIRKVFYPVQFDYLFMEDENSSKYIHFLSERLNMMDSIWKASLSLRNDRINIQEMAHTDSRKMVREMFSVSNSLVPDAYRPVFIRNSVANTADGSVVANGVPRFDENGLLVEEGSNNLCDQVLQGMGLVYTYVETTADGYKKYGISGTWSNGTYPYSFNVGKCDMTQGIAYSGSVFVYTNVPEKFKPNFGQVIIVNKLSTTNTGSYRNDKYASYFNFTPQTSITNNPLYVFSCPIENGIVFNPDIDFIYVKCSQIEAKVYPTSYIDSKIIRGDEQLTVPSNVLNVNEGTIEFDFIAPRYIYSGGASVLIALNNDITSKTNMYVQLSASREIQLIVGTGDYRVVLYSGIFVIAGVKYRVAFKWSNNEISLVVNGVIKANSRIVSALMLTGYIYIGRFGTSTYFLNSYFLNLRISNIARTDEELSYTGDLTVDEYTTYWLPLRGNLDCYIYPELKKNTRSTKFELAGISDMYQSGYGNLYKETMAIAEAYSQYISVIKKENIQATETYWDNISFIVRILENVTIREAVMQNLCHVIVVQMKLLDGISKRIIPLKKEIFNLSDTMNRVCIIYRTFMEAMQAIDATSRQMELMKSNRIGFNDHKSNNVFHEIYEVVLVAESFNRDMKFSRIAKELLFIGDVLSKYQGKIIPEYLMIADAYVRACNAILEAIRVSGGELTLEQFKKDINIPYTFEEFTDFNVGDYEYEKALMRLQVISNATHSQPMLYDVALHVDVDDTNDSGIVEITDITAATKVYYNKHYYNAPEVQVTLRGGSAFAMPSIMSTDKIDEKGRYFEVELLDSTSNRVTGIISWVSKGW